MLGGEEKVPPPPTSFFFNIPFPSPLMPTLLSRALRAPLPSCFSHPGPFNSWGPCFLLYPFFHHPRPQPISLISLASSLKVPLGSSPSFGLCYRGEAEALEAKTSSTAPSERGGEEEALQQSHLESMGSP